MNIRYNHEYINPLMQSFSTNLIGGFNLIIRRDGKVNNFAAVLQTLRDIINHELTIISATTGKQLSLNVFM